MSLDIGPPGMAVKEKCNIFLSRRTFGDAESRPNCFGAWRRGFNRREYKTSVLLLLTTVHQKRNLSTKAQGLRRLGNIGMHGKTLAASSVDHLNQCAPTTRSTRAAGAARVMNDELSSAFSLQNSSLFFSTAALTVRLDGFCLRDTVASS